MVFYYWLVFMLPMANHWLWAHQFGPLNVIKSVGLVCFAIAVIHLAAKGSLPPLHRQPEVWCSLAFLFVELLSYSLRDLAELGFQGMAKILAIFSLLIVTVILVDTQDRWRRVFLVMIAGQTISSLYAIRQWLAFRGVYTQFRSFGGLTDDANYFAMAVVLWLPVTFMSISAATSRFERLFCRACALAMLAGFLVVGSRGGLVGLACAALLIIWRSQQRARNLILVMMLGFTLLAGSTVSRSSAVSRLLHPSPGDVQSAQARVDLLRTGLGIVRSRPLLGVGYARWSAALYAGAHFHVAHNTYLDILGQLGLAGFVPFLGILVFSYRRLGALAKQAEDSAPELQRAAIGFQAGLAGYFVGAFFLSAWWQDVFWLLAFLSMRLPWLRPAAHKAWQPMVGPRLRRVSEPRLGPASRGSLTRWHRHPKAGHLPVPSRTSRGIP
jgi:O-antigen ligase